MNRREISKILLKQIEIEKNSFTETDEIKKYKKMKRQLENALITKNFKDLDFNQIVKLTYGDNKPLLKELIFHQNLSSNPNAKKLYGELYTNGEAKALKSLDQISLKLTEKISLLEQEQAKDKIFITKDTVLQHLYEKISDFDQFATISSNELDILVETLKKANYSNQKIIDMIIEVTANTIRKLNSSKLLPSKEIEEINLPVTSLNKNDIVGLFKLYRYDFSLFTPQDRKLILKYSSSEKIFGILKLFDKYKFRMDLRNYSSKLAPLFVYSAPYLIENVINTIPKETMKQDFNIFLNRPSIFISKRFITDDGVVIGAYNNYIENIKLFDSLGLQNISSTFRRCSSPFTRNSSQIKSLVNAFDTYQIPKAVYLYTLSAFNNYNPIPAIDQFIELGCLEYLKDNFSRVNLNPNDPIFYRIKKARQLSATDDEIYTRFQNGGAGRIYIRLNENITKNGFGITKDNCSEKVEEFIPKTKKICDNVLKQNDVFVTPTLVFEDELIQKLEAFKTSELAYNIGGVTISRYKVLCNYEKYLRSNLDSSVDNIKDALFRNSILTKIEYDKVIKAINELYSINLERTI